MIPEPLYREIVQALPILCVDVVLTNPKHEYLLVKRANEPLKGEWWVIGGRVLKGETLAQAAVRKVREEVGLEIGPPELVGVFEAPTQKDPFGQNNEYHAVSAVYHAQILQDEAIVLDAQSVSWRFHKVLPERFLIQSFSPFKKETR